MVWFASGKALRLVRLHINFFSTLSNTKSISKETEIETQTVAVAKSDDRFAKTIDAKRHLAALIHSKVFTEIALQIIRHSLISMLLGPH